jgi:hypothetical protein
MAASVERLHTVGGTKGNSKYFSRILPFGRKTRPVGKACPERAIWRFMFAPVIKTRAFENVWLVPVDSYEATNTYPAENVAHPERYGLLKKL